MNRRITSRVLAAVCALLLVLAPLCGLADGGVTLTATMGYDGAITYVRKVPVDVTIQNDGLSDIAGRLSVQVNRFSEYDLYEMPVSVAAGASARFTLPVVLTQKQTDYTVRLMQGEETLASYTLRPEAVINPSDLIIGTLSSDAQSLAGLAITKNDDPLARREYWSVLALDEKTFPSDAESLRFFDMLAVDGFDMSTLSDAQKQAFDEWLQNGGIALVGGGARAAEDFPFFKAYTGIRAGALERKNVGALLMDALQMSGESPEQNATVVSLEGASGQSMGEGRLIDVRRVGDGYVLTAGFSLSEKPLAGWLGRAAVWQRVLLASAKTRYQSIVEFRQSGIYNQTEYYPSTSIAESIGVKNGAGMIWPLALLGAFVMLAGVGGYMILKKLDRREWLWAAVPVLALAAALGMWGLSSRLPIRDPVAVHYTLLDIDEDGAATGNTVVVASKPEKGGMTLSINGGAIDMTSSLSYYSTGVESAAQTLRYIYTYGDEETITYQQTQAWQSQCFMVRKAPIVNVSGVKGECVWDGESMRFTITNGSSVTLADGFVLTDFGFVSVPELLPGQTAECVMRPAVKEEEAQQDNSAAQGAANLTGAGGMRGPRPVPMYYGRNDTEIRDGVIIDEKDRSNVYSYELLEAVYSAKRSAAATQSERKTWWMRYNLISNTNLTNYDLLPHPFLYIAFSDELDTLRVRMDGRDVAREAQIGCVMAQLHYNPISADGTARFIKNSFPVSIAKVDDNGRPAVGDTLPENSYQSFTLSTTPAFAFDVSALPNEMEITKADIASRYSYYAYRISLYNVKTGQWDEWKEFTPDSTGGGTVKGCAPELRDYIAGGVLFARFEKPDAGDDYADVSMPTLTLEGRVQ